MARVKLDLPTHFPFNTKIKIRITDLNYGGHLGNDAVLSLMQEARVQYLNSLGFSGEVNIVDDVGLIQTDAVIVYKAETFYGETLLVEVAANDFNKYGFDFVYKLSSVENNREVARGKTGMVCFNYTSRKVVLVPEHFRNKLQE